MLKKALKDYWVLLSVFGPIAVLFILLIIFQYRSYTVNKERLESQLARQQELVTALAASRVQFFVQDVDYELRELAEAVSVAHDPNTQGEAVGRSYDELQDEVDGVVYIDSEGRKELGVSRPKTMENFPENCRYEELFTTPRLTKVTYISELKKLPGGGEVIYIARPVKGGGVVLAQVGCTALAKLCGQLEDVSHDMRFAYYDQRGQRMCAGKGCDFTDPTPRAGLMESGGQASTMLDEGTSKRRRLLYRPFIVGGYRWYVSSVMPMSGVDRLTHGDYIFLFGLGCLFVLSLAAGGVYFRSTYKAKVKAETESAYNRTLAGQREALEEEKDKLVAVLNSIPDGIMLLDGEGAVLDANSKARELMPFIAQETKEPGQEGKEGEKAVGGKTYRVVSVPFVGKARGPLKEVRLLRDVTSEKSLDKKKADLVSMITHDIKSPLTAIIGLSNWISEEVPREELPEDVMSSITTISRAAGRINVLMDNFLFLSSVEVAHKLHKKPVDLNQFLKRACSEFQVEAKKKGVRLNYTQEERLSIVDIDEDQMMRAVANLIGNAIKYTPAGSDIDIFAKHFWDYVAITVKDNGPGISSIDLPFIFERHYRGKTTEKGVKGSGLGLAIVKAVVEAHGGKVDVESEEGKGASFTIRLPLDHEAEALKDE